MRTLFLIFILCLNFSCKKEKRVPNQSPVIENIVEKSEQKLRKVLSKEKSKKVVEDFYSWYLLDVKTGSKYPQVNYLKIDNETYIYDKSSYIRTLKETPYFSEEYINNISDQFDECNKLIKQVVFKHEPEGGGAGIPECNFLWYDLWIGGQGESMDRFQIWNTEIKKDQILITVNLFVEKFNPLSSKITVVNENGKYKISNIELVYN